MNVIRFPNSHPGAGSDHDLELTSDLVVALHAVGEPATAEEIISILRSTLRTSSSLESVAVFNRLATYSQRSCPGLADTPLFRCVTLRGAPAWAFTSAFRDRLRGVGVQAHLRPMDLESGTAGQEKATRAASWAHARVEDLARRRFTID